MEPGDGGRPGWLRREVRRWVEEGILTQAQAEAILARHPEGGPAAAEPGAAGDAAPPAPAVAATRAAEKSRRTGRAVAILSTLAVILIGIGAILFFAANWSGIPRAGKLAIVLAPLVGSFLLAWRFRFRPGEHPYIGEALLLLGTILYGSAIFLVAQIYHIRAHWPNGVLWWWAGAILLAYAAPSLSALVVALLLVPVWIGCESFFWFRAEHDEAVAVILPCIALSLGVLYVAAARLHRRFRATRPLAGPWDALGSVLALGAAYVLSFGWVHKEMDHDLTQAPRALAWGIAIAVLALLAALAALRLRAAGDRLWDALAPLVLLGISVLFAAVPGEKVWPVLFNFVLLALVLWLVRHGLRDGLSWPVNLAVAFFVLLVVTRYFDSFWNLMPRSLFFILGGALLLGGGILLERQRRRILARLGERAR